MHQLKSIAISRDSLIRFEQLIINYTLLTPPNTEKKLRTIEIWFCGRCWCTAELTARFSTLWIIVVYPLFIASHDTVQETFSAVEAVVHTWRCNKICSKKVHVLHKCFYHWRFWFKWIAFYILLAIYWFWESWNFKLQVHQTLLLFYLF